jgi:hypothetical protein
VRAVFASKVAAVLNQFAGEPFAFEKKREIAKQVNAMLRDWGLQLQSPNGEPVPLVVNPGGERDREGVFIVGRGAGSVTTRYPEVVFIPASPKRPRGE